MFVTHPYFFFVFFFLNVNINTHVGAIVETHAYRTRFVVLSHGYVFPASRDPRIARASSFPRSLKSSKIAGTPSVPCVYMCIRVFNIRFNAEKLHFRVKNTKLFITFREFLFHAREARVYRLASSFPNVLAWYSVRRSNSVQNVDREIRIFLRDSS